MPTRRKGGAIMAKKIYELKKIPGVFYAFTYNGIELPVLDTTNPLFIESINEEKLNKMIKEIKEKGAKRAECFDKMPSFIKNFLARRSYIMAGFLLKDTDDDFLSGMSTMLMKLGPGFIGRGKKKLLDRLGSQSIGAVTLRMRIRDMCALQTDILRSQLAKDRYKNLCIINIAGGTAIDSINTLIHLYKINPSFLLDRIIEINVLDVDAFGPIFAKNCVESLKTFGGYFHNLNVSLRHIVYHWKNTVSMAELLKDREDWLKICSSEGGLFEYASDEEIIENLNTIYQCTKGDLKIVGSVIREENNVDPGILASLKITKIKARLLGLDGLKKIIDKTNWKLCDLIQDNPRYLVFSLRRN